MALKVYDLQCDAGHVFEGWFASADNYEQQRARGLLACPVCDSREVAKKPSASRLNMGRAREPEAAPALPAAAGRSESLPVAQLQAQVLQRLRQIVRDTDNVGDRFAQEARRMHEGEIEHRAIRGTATPQERQELAQDGIAVLAIPDFLDDDRLQ